MQGTYHQTVNSQPLVFKIIQFIKILPFRVHAFRSTVECFCRENSDGQVISLGAGSDTLYWHLLKQGLSPTYLELDFPEVIQFIS